LAAGLQLNAKALAGWNGPLMNDPKERRNYWVLVIGGAALVTVALVALLLVHGYAGEAVLGYVAALSPIMVLVGLLLVLRRRSIPQMLLRAAAGTMAFITTGVIFCLFAYGMLNLFAGAEKPDPKNPYIRCNPNIRTCPEPVRHRVMTSAPPANKPLQQSGSPP
jgi:hypothetical protein